MLPLGKFLVKVESVTSAKCETNSFCVMACRCRCISMYSFDICLSLILAFLCPTMKSVTSTKHHRQIRTALFCVDRWSEILWKYMRNLSIIYGHAFRSKKNPFWKICFNLDREYSFTERSFHVSWNWFENKQLDVLTSQIIILWIILHSHEQVQCSEAIILHLQMDIFGINIFQNWNCCLSIFQLFFRHCIVRIIWKENATFSH